MTLLLAAAAFAVEPTAEIETVAQLRHDLWGETYVPAWQYLRVHRDAHGAVAYGYGFDAYLGLEWIAGVERPADVDLYALSVQGELPRGRWVAGRQQAFSALRPQTFDGGRLTWRAGDDVTLAAWAGQARHQDLDDLADGVTMGRAEATLHRGGLVARAGAQVEAGEGTPFVAREDVEARWTPDGAPLRADVSGRVVVAEPSFAVEWARLEVGARPLSAVRASVHAQHREAADPSALFGDAILEALAGGAVDEAGVGVRVSGARFAVLHATWSVATYGPGAWGADVASGGDTPSYGHAADVTWTPGISASATRVLPSWSFRAGPGGAYHAASVTASHDLSDAVRVSGRLAVVPYKKGREDWDLVVAGGADGRVAIARWLAVGAQIDAASDRLFRVDVRGGGSLTLAVP